MTRCVIVTWADGQRQDGGSRLGRRLAAKSSAPTLASYRGMDIGTARRNIPALTVQCPVTIDVVAAD